MLKTVAKCIPVLREYWDKFYSREAIYGMNWVMVKVVQHLYYLAIEVAFLAT